MRPSKCNARSLCQCGVIWRSRGTSSDEQSVVAGASLPDTQSIFPEAIEVEVFGVCAMLTPRVRTAVRRIRRNIAAVTWHTVYDYVPYGAILSNFIEPSFTRGKRKS